MFKVLKSLATIFAAAPILSSLALADVTQDHYQYPTQWQLVNRAHSPIVLTCSGTAYGLSSPVPLDSFRLAPGQEGMFNWGGWYYNDGLGLNPASWTCKDELSGTVFASFDSGWGEKVRLTVQQVGSRLTLRKSSY